MKFRIHKKIEIIENMKTYFQNMKIIFVLTCVLPLPVCPYAKHVAMPFSNILSTNGLAVNLKLNEKTFTMISLHNIYKSL